MESATLLPNNLNNYYQNYDVNFTSRSEMIFFGTPYLQIQCSKKRLAASRAVSEVLHGIKQQTREKRSMILKIASLPRGLSGKDTTKSIVTCSKGTEGFSTGYKRPGGFYVLCLFY